MKALSLLLLTAVPAVALDYKRDIMPIFKTKCYDCHSADAKKLRGGLRLDDEQHFYKRLTKNNVVIPGDWDASYLFVVVTLPEEDEDAMPPEGKGERLTEKEMMLVAEWIQDGARINNQRGDRGAPEMDPKKILRFKDGKLMKEEFGVTPPTPEATDSEWENWTNTDGKTISAKFQGLEQDKVKLELKNGKTVAYPLNQLSAESQKNARRVRTINAPRPEEK